MSIFPEDTTDHRENIRSFMPLYIGIDDTDSPESIGTGRLSRGIAAIITETYPVQYITRHQFFVHPSIPYTSHNSGAVICLDDIPPEEYPRLFGLVTALVRERSAVGSDPGVALAGSAQIIPALVRFGLDAKDQVLTQDRARAIAGHAGILLEGLGGTEGGVIGALAGIGLAASGSDGRYLQIGSIRDHHGDVEISDLLHIGIDQVMTVEGRTLTGGRVHVPKFPQPLRIMGTAVLLVEERDDGYHAIRRD